MPKTHRVKAVASRIEQMRRDALALPPIEKAALVAALLASLDCPDPRIDTLWAQEAEDRLAAYEAGEMEAIPAETALDEIERL